MPSGLSTKNKSLVQIGDKFRELRFAIRRVKELARHSDTNDRRVAIFELAYLLANASNSFLNTAETSLISMLSAETESHLGNARAYGIERYFGLTDQSNPTEDEIRFTRDQYFASKRVFMTATDANVLLHQGKFLQVWQHCCAELTRRAQSGTTSNHQMAAIFTLAVLDIKPVRSPEFFNRDHLDYQIGSNTFLATALAFVTLVAGDSTDRHDDDYPEDSVVFNSCISAAMSLHQNVLGIINKEDTDPVEALADFYASNVQYLP